MCQYLDATRSPGRKNTVYTLYNIHTVYMYNLICSVSIWMLPGVLVGRMPPSAQPYWPRPGLYHPARSGEHDFIKFCQITTRIQQCIHSISLQNWLLSHPILRIWYTVRKVCRISRPYKCEALCHEMCRKLLKFKWKSPSSVSSNCL